MLLPIRTVTGWDQTIFEGSATEATVATVCPFRVVMLPEGRKNCAVAIASRALPESQIDVHQPGKREVMGRTYNRLLRLSALHGLHDTQCGFKAFTADAAIACFTPLKTLRFGFDAEVLLRARRLGWTIAEVPVRWEHKEDSRVSAMRDSVGVLYDLVRLRFIVRR